MQVGYGNKELARAGAEALRTLPYYNHFFKTTNPWTVELAAKLTTLLPKGHSRVLFANSGSEANDAALKLIRYYWNLKGRPEKKIHVSRQLSYHGVTMAAASLSGLTPMHPQWDLPFPGFAKVPTPYWYGAKAAGYGDIGEDEFGIEIARETEKAIREIGPERIASFSIEPVQGAGGLIIAPKTYWPEIARICRQYDILLHADEVVTGFGRTGEWFGSFTYGIEPDILTMAKGLSSGYQPISAISLGARMGEAIAQADEELVHGYTYAGHPVASAVALKNLEVLEKQAHRAAGQADDRSVLPAPGPAGVRRPPPCRRGSRRRSPGRHRARRGQGAAATLPERAQRGDDLPRSLLQQWSGDAGDPRHDGAGAAAGHHGGRGGEASGQGEALHRPDGSGFGGELAPAWRGFSANAGFMPRLSTAKLAKSRRTRRAPTRVIMKLY